MATTISDAVDDSVDEVKSEVYGTVNKIVDTVRMAAEVLGEKGADIKNAEEWMMENCCNYVRARPLTAIGIAVAAGYLLGRLVEDPQE
jgi:ElaB/YqjD/DUF883 family membrane-anchored ribosome-binding protein